MIFSDQFLPFIHPEVTQAPRGLVLQYINEALQSIYKIRGTTIEHLSPMVLPNDQDFVVLVKVANGGGGIDIAGDDEAAFGIVTATPGIILGDTPFSPMTRISLSWLRLLTVVAV